MTTLRYGDVVSSVEPTTLEEKLKNRRTAEEKSEVTTEVIEQTDPESNKPKRSK